MVKRGMVVVVTLVMVIGVYHLLAQAPQTPAGVKIGVVNVAEVFNKYKRRQQLSDALEKEKKEEEVKIKDMENQIEELKKQIKALDTESELRMEKESQVKILTMQLEDRVKRWNKRINLKVNEQTALLYSDIRDAVAKYARENQFTMILKTDPALERDLDESATYRINIRAIIYADPTIDLTEEIIKVLNK